MTLMKNMGGGGVMVNQPSPGSAFHRAAESPNYPLHVQLLTNSPFSIPFVLIFMHRIGGVEVPIHPQRSDARTTILRSIPFPFILFRTHCQKHAACGFTSHRPTPALSGPPVTSHGSPVIIFVTSQLFARPVTCPEDVHPPYYWSEPLPPTNCLRVTVPSFFCMGGCDG